MIAAMARALVALLALAAPARAAETVVELPTRPGASLRMLVEAPANPVGSVVLLAGGNGELDLGADGTIKNFYGNPPVRTRGLYRDAGFAIGVLDVADLAAAIAHMRAIAAPVAVIGFSRGAIPTAAAARLAGAARPDALVLFSGMWLTTRVTPTSVEYVLKRDGAFAQPALLVVHGQDACPFSNPGELARFRPLLGGSARAETLTLQGGGPPRGDRCGPFHFHGHVGLDDEIVAAVAAWLKAPPR